MQQTIPEAFVSLSLAIWLIEQNIANGDVSVAIDGAMVRVHGKRIFDPVIFLAEKGWKHTKRSANGAALLRMMSTTSRY